MGQEDRTMTTHNAMKIKMTIAMREERNNHRKAFLRIAREKGYETAAEIADATAVNAETVRRWMKGTVPRRLADVAIALEHIKKAPDNKHFLSEAARARQKRESRSSPPDPTPAPAPTPALALASTSAMKNGSKPEDEVIAEKEQMGGEIAALAKVADAIAPLTEAEAKRVLAWAADRFGA
jgi:predicted transcriptional regulator